MSKFSFDEALQHLLAAAVPVQEKENLAIEVALGRVLAEGQTSAIEVPPHDNSAMDGYALRSADVPVAGMRLPVSQRIPAGAIGHALQAGTAARIFTGAPVPAGADGVVMQELCDHTGDLVTINHVPKPGENIRRRGEDIALGAEVVPAGTRLNPQALGLLASVGIARVPVWRRLRVALFSTGNELVNPGQPLPPGGIYNSNRYLLKGLLERLGCEVTDLGIVADTLADTRQALRQAAGGHDLILTSGGVSVGEEDHVKPAVEAEGALSLWAIAIKPGKPLAFGHVNAADGSKAAFIGVPGNPVAAFVTFILLVRPFIRRCQGLSAAAVPALRLPVAFDWKKSDPRRNFLRVRVNAEGQLELFANQGSGVLTSTLWSDGLADVAPGQTLTKGDVVSYLPFTALMD
ncbi:MAG: molybdopterin molybdenumtransferase MoeA [Rhodocyclaceae bacterium]|nr:MAG: molybdopterin molybdenumtransferase MoeA [Rhodocyclaceae bacterium]